MKFINFLLVFSLLALVSCSSGDKKSDGDEDGTETALEDSGDEDADFVVDSDEDEDEDGDEIVDADEDELVAEDSTESIAEAESTEEVNVSDNSISVSGDSGQYSVNNGDTLMLISFKIYGDYRRWREISDLNPGVDSQSLSSGQAIKYNAPSEKFVWNPKGEPYLIRDGDTLGTISGDKYGNRSRWQDIYNNNRPMIRDPHLIFAGFTLYYIPDDRSVAQE